MVPWHNCMAKLHRWASLVVMLEAALPAPLPWQQDNAEDNAEDNGLTLAPACTVALE